MADINDKLTELNNTNDSTGEFNPQDIQENKIMCIFAYLSWLVLIPLIMAKDSKFARFHCNQGIVLAIAEIIAFAIFGILTKAPLIGWIFGILEGLLELICFLFSVIGIINAVNGKAKDLPIIGKIRIFK